MNASPWFSNSAAGIYCTDKCTTVQGTGKAGLVRVFTLIASSALNFTRIVALDNAELFISFLLSGLISSISHPHLEPQRTDCRGAFTLSSRACEGPGDGLLGPANPGPGWDCVPDVVWNTEQNACASKQTRGLNRANPSFHHINNMWKGWSTIHLVSGP